MQQEEKMRVIFKYSVGISLHAGKGNEESFTIIGTLLYILNSESYKRIKQKFKVTYTYEILYARNCPTLR